MVADQARDRRRLLREQIRFERDLSKMSHSSSNQSSGIEVRSRSFATITNLTLAIAADLSREVFGVFHYREYQHVTATPLEMDAVATGSSTARSSSPSSLTTSKSDIGSASRKPMFGRRDNGCSPL